MPLYNLMWTETHYWQAQVEADSLEDAYNIFDDDAFINVRCVQTDFNDDLNIEEAN